MYVCAYVSNCRFAGDVGVSFVGLGGTCCRDRLAQGWGGRSLGAGMQSDSAMRAGRVGAQAQTTCSSHTV